MIRSPQQSPLALRISVTDRCQLRCSYCMPPEGVPKKSHSDILSFEEIVRFVRMLKSSFGLSKVRITGGEPLIRPGVVELIGCLACEGIAAPWVFHVAVNRTAANFHAANPPSS